MFLVAAYFAGLGFVAVAAAQHGLTAQQRKTGLEAQRWWILGLGVAMKTLFLVPFLGILMLPVGVAAGTILFSRCESSSAATERGVSGRAPARP